MTSCSATWQVNEQTRPFGAHIDVQYVGICGTDLQIFNGGRPDSARVLGHEGVGYVAGPTGRTMVVFNPVSPTNQDRVLGHSCDGIMKRYVAAGDDAFAFAVPVTETLSPFLACLTEPLATAAYSIEMVHAWLPGRVLVVGGGAIGVMHALLAWLAGSAVTLVTRKPSRLTWITERFEPHFATRSSASTIEDVDVALLCVPSSESEHAVRVATRALRPNGAIISSGRVAQAVAGVHLGGFDVNAARRRNVLGEPRGGVLNAVAATQLGKTLYVGGHRGTSVGHLMEALRILAGPHGPLIGRLVTHVVAPAAAPALLESLAGPGPRVDARGEEIVKCLIDFGNAPPCEVSRDVPDGDEGR